MKNTVLIAVITALLFSFSVSCLANNNEGEEITDFSQTETCLPRVYISAKGKAGWQTYLGEKVKAGLVKTNKVTVCPIDGSTEANNKASDYTRLSGRYKEETVPKAGEYIAPTHQLRITTAPFNWKTIQISSNSIKGLINLFGHHDDCNIFYDDYDEDVEYKQRTLFVELTAEILDMQTNVVVGTASGKAEANAYYFSTDGFTSCIKDDLINRATTKAVDNLIANIDFTKIKVVQ